MSETITKMNPLGTDKIGTLMVRFAVPSIVAMVVNSLYNMVDQVFIGQGVGYLGNAATNIILPLSIALMAVGLMIGDGAAAFMSLSLGKGERDTAARGVGNAIVMILVSSVALSIIGVIFLEPLCILFGATDAVLPYALEFGFVIVLGFPVGAICCGFAGVIRADGRPNITMVGLLIGFVVNIALNPLFIFVCEWGVMGSALATTIGQALNALFFVACLFRFKTIKLDKSCFLLRLRTCGRILALGIASFVTQIVTVLVIYFLNNAIVEYGASSRFGSDIPLAAYGVAMKVSNLLLGIVMGLAIGIQPIFGYNYGSGQYKRVKKTYKLALVWSIIILVLAFIIFQVWPEQIAYLFDRESELYREFSVLCFRICMLACVAIGPGMVTGVFFQAIGKPVQAAILSLSRQAVFLIPSALILGYFFGVVGVLWSSPLSDVAACAMSLIMVRAYWNKLFQGGKDEL